MTMGLIRHGTPRAGFKGWQTEENVPGWEEPQIAKMACPDPNSEKTRRRAHMKNVGKHPEAKQ